MLTMGMMMLTMGMMMLAMVKIGIVHTKESWGGTTEKRNPPWIMKSQFLLFHDYLLLQTFIQFIVEMERLPQPGINFRPDFLQRTCWSAGLMVARMANSSHMWLPSNVCTILRGQQANRIKIAVNVVWPKIAQGHLGKSREWGVRRSEPARRPKAERPWGPQRLLVVITFSLGFLKSTSAKQTCLGSSNGMEMAWSKSMSDRGYWDRGGCRIQEKGEMGALGELTHWLVGARGHFNIQGCQFSKRIY